MYTYFVYYYYYASEKFWQKAPAHLQIFDAINKTLNLAASVADDFFLLYLTKGHSLITHTFANISFFLLFDPCVCVCAAAFVVVPFILSTHRNSYKRYTWFIHKMVYHVKQNRHFYMFRDCVRLNVCNGGGGDGKEENIKSFIRECRKMKQLSRVCSTTTTTRSGQFRSHIY